MASKQVAELQILLKAFGVEKTTKQVEAVVGKLKKLAGAQSKVVETGKKVNASANKTKRNLEGVAQRSGSTAKDFSRMSQGMGGLVQAYATVAANVFALSSAFLVLRNAADLSSMMKSAEDFSTRYGISVLRVTKQLQIATGGALSFAEALPTVNKAISAGVPIEKMEQLAIAATKAAQTFGGSTTEALNRFISASQRGRVEIIQTLGVIIKTEQAYEKYAATIGKMPLELSAFDRQQAILNATIEASKNVFEGIKIDPNPFTQLLVTLADLKDTFATFVTDTLTPLIETFNKSRDAAGALMAVIALAVGKRIFPELTSGVAGFAAAGKASSTAARSAHKNALHQLAKAKEEESKLIIKSNTDAYRQADKAFTQSLGDRVKANSTFSKSILLDNGKVNAAILKSKRALLTKEIALREAGTEKGRQKALAGQTLPQLKQQQRVYDQVALSVRKVVMSEERRLAATTATTNAIKIGMKKSTAAVSAFGAATTKVTSTIKSGFAQGFQVASGNWQKGFKGASNAWQIFGRDLRKGTKEGASHLNNFARASSRSFGIIAGAVSKAFSALTSLFLLYSIGKLVWSTFGDKIQGITESEREVLNATNDLTEGLAKSNEILSRGIELWGEKAPKSLKDFSSALTFVSGNFETIANEIGQFQKKAYAALNNLSVEGAITRVSELRRELVDLRSETETSWKWNPFSAVPFINTDELAAQKNKAIKEIKELEGAFEGLAAGKQLQGIINQFERSAEFAKRFGITASASLIDVSSRLDSLKGKVSDVDFRTLVAAFKSGDFDRIRTAIELVNKNLVKTPEILAQVKIHLAELLKAASTQVSGLNRQIANALNELVKIDDSFATFLKGTDKLRSQKSPFKEFYGYALDTVNTLQSIVDAQEVSVNMTLQQAFAENLIIGDLKTIVSLIGSENVSIQKALELSKAKVAVYAEQLKVQLFGAKELKLLELELQKIKLESAKSDEDRLRILKSTLDAQENILELKSELDAATARAAGAVYARAADARQQGLLSEDELERRKLEYEIATSQANLAKATLTTARAENAIKKDVEPLNIQLQIEKNLQQQLSIRQKMNNTARNYTKSSAEMLGVLKLELRLDERIYQSKLRELEIEKEKLMAQQIKNALYERDLALQDLKIEALRQEYELQLKLKQLQVDARGAEQTKTSIFDKKGLKLAARFFVDEVAAQARKLKTTFEILGRGMVTVVNQGFDKMVDTLLEGVWGKGGRDFGRAVLESIKAGMRDVFGDALKSKIRESISLLFGQESDEVKLQNAIEEGNIIAQEAKAELEKINSTLKRTPTGPDNGGITAENPFTTITTQLVENDSNFIKGNQAVTKVLELLRSDSKSGFFGVIQALFSLITVMTTSSVSGAGSFISTIISAFSGGGGSAGGGAKVPRGMASGGMVTAPTVALIGEGKRNEAVVPLPNNREIPVDMKGASGDTINIEQNFDFTNADNSSIPTLRAEARAIEDRTFNRVFSEINKGGRYAKITGRR